MFFGCARVFIKATNLKNAVNDVPIRSDQEDIIVAKVLLEIADNRMIQLMGFAVAAAILGAVEQLLGTRFKGI